MATASRLPDAAQPRGHASTARTDTAMSDRAWDWARRCQDVTLDQRLVLFALTEHADDHGECLIRSPGPLDRMTELNERRMAKVLNAVATAQLIVSERGGCPGVTHHRLLLDGMETGGPGALNGYPA
jgi:hypothetical protein